MPPTAIFGFRAQWRVLPGMAYGQRLPVMRSSVVVAPVGRPALALLDRAMARHIPEAIPAQGLSPAYEISLVQRALHWAAALQRQLKLPVSLPPETLQRKTGTSARRLLKNSRLHCENSAWAG